MSDDDEFWYQRCERALAVYCQPAQPGPAPEEGWVALAGAGRTSCEEQEVTYRTLRVG